jgi:hypothetical protein
VIVHVHDILLPAEYKRRTVLEKYRFWTEQYLLQAFLTFNDSFEILWTSHFMHLSTTASKSSGPHTSCTCAIRMYSRRLSNPTGGTRVETRVHR